MSLQLGGEGVAPSPRERPVPRKATSPFVPVNRNPLTVSFYSNNSQKFFYRLYQRSVTKTHTAQKIG